MAGRELRERLAFWLSANLGGLIVWYKTNSALWLILWSIVIGAIRYAPLLCRLDRISWEAKQEGIK